MRSSVRRGARALKVVWAEVRERNKAKLDEGTFEGDIVPIGLRPSEPKVKNNVKVVKVAAETKTYLHLGDEEPECPKAIEVTVDPDESEGKPIMSKAIEVTFVADESEDKVTDGGAASSSDAVVPSLLKELTTRASEKLAKKEYEALEEEFEAKATLEDLSDNDRNTMRR